MLLFFHFQNWPINYYNHYNLANPLGMSLCCSPQAQPIHSSIHFVIALSIGLSAIYTTIYTWPSHYTLNSYSRICWAKPFCMITICALGQPNFMATIKKWAQLG